LAQFSKQMVLHPLPFQYFYPVWTYSLLSKQEWHLKKKKIFFLCQRLGTKTIVHDSCVLLLLQILLQKGVLWNAIMTVAVHEAGLFDRIWSRYRKKSCQQVKNRIIKCKSTCHLLFIFHLVL
jgi:hypothetical protein